MIDSLKMDAMGDPWCLTIDLGAAGTGDLVVPAPFREDPAVPIAGDRYVDRWQLVVLGMSYVFGAAAPGDGFRLLSVTASSSTQVWEDIASGAGRVDHDAGELWLPLQPAAAEAPTNNPATLRLELTGGALSNGHLLIWGIHRPAAGKSDIDSSTLTYT